MPRSCSICTHAQTAEISKAISSGASNRSIAERYGLVHTSVQRHRTNCLKQQRRTATTAPVSMPSEAPGTERFESSEPKALIATTVRLVDKALTFMEQTLNQRDFFVGDSLTVADIALLAYTRLAGEGGFDLSSRTALRSWIRRCEQALGLPPV